MTGPAFNCRYVPNDVVYARHSGHTSNWMQLMSYLPPSSLIHLWSFCPRKLIHLYLYYF